MGQPTNIINVTYEQTGKSQHHNDMGMRAMQARTFKERDAKYLLVKAPPASGKSRALMFVGLDKLHQQGLRKVIVAVPERSIGNSFRSTDLTSYGFPYDWEINPRWNLCTMGAEAGAVAHSKVKSVGAFLESDDQTLVCTHATLRFAYADLGASAFDECVVAVDEFHHVSNDEDSRLGEVVRGLMARGSAHLVAMTGSYFRGDAMAVLHPDDEAKFRSVTYSYYEQLNGYEFLKTLGIGYHFYRGPYLDALMEVFDTTKKTILHIPNVNSAASTGDKYAEVNQILELMGEYLGVDSETGFIRIKTDDGRILKVADLVDDGDQRGKVQDSLRLTEDRDAVDVIIALGMAKEGFDWVWCEHALTVGYRNSLTELIQIIGRSTRDAPNKIHAQFTNLIAEPDAVQGEVVGAVNDMLKAISASLLMEQVLMPKFRFHTKRDPEDDDKGTGFSDGPQADFEFDGETGEIHIGIRGLKEPSTPEVQQIVEQDMNDLIAHVCQDTNIAKHGAANDELAPEVVNKLMIPRIINDRYPDRSEEEQEEIRQQLVARMNIIAGAKKEAEQNPTQQNSILKMVKKFVNVRELDIDLIDTINPFQQAYEVISKNLDAPTLAQIHSAVAAGRISVNEDEVKDLFPKLKEFLAKNKRRPSLTSDDPVELRLAEIMAWIDRKRREREAGGDE